MPTIQPKQPYIPPSEPGKSKKGEPAPATTPLPETSEKEPTQKSDSGTLKHTVDAAHADSVIKKLSQNVLSKFKKPE